MLTLVTGLSGFTGPYIKTEFEKNGHKVIGLNSDLIDSKAITAEIKQIQPDTVVHLAGISFVKHENINTIYDVNLMGTRNLLAALEQEAINIKSILLVSSANIYGNRSEAILQENAAPDPSNDYAVSKLAMENMANLWVNRLPIFIVRPFNYTGVGQDKNFLIPKIVSHFHEKKAAIELGNLQVWREFGDVRAVAEIYRKLIEKRPRGKIINICTGHPYSLREAINLCKEITGHDIEIKINQDFIRKNEVRILTGDNTLLKKTIINWTTHTLKDTLSWMLKDGKTL
jgi:GDP-6-deoxy-D-talose 4-dehydrogenase